MKELNADKLVNHVLALWDNGIDKDGIVLENIMSEFGLSEDDAVSYLEQIKTGLSHARMVAGGNEYPNDNLSENPILKAAMKIGLSKLGHSEQNLSPRKKWWKFW